ncbi:hypothetical protein [Rubeoparvulum massiliense]|uniref:hypothetical protein n=1 Tax=Rubeoparvulum massiliense TaxID=1631346 RepID=UPI00065E500F|nr:hypothetical protein [Rubeoparvulum massiliense]
MDDVKRKIIVTEIESWKRNQLLPAHYCDFLLNLYTEGEVSSSAEGLPQSSGAKHFLWEKLKRFKWLLLVLVSSLTGIIYLAYHFTDFDPTMQILFVGFLFLLLLGTGAWLLKRKEPFAHLFMGSAALLLIWLAFLLQFQLGDGMDSGLKPSFLLLIALLWLLMGFIFKVPYLIIGGEIALVLCYAIWLYPQIDGESIWIVQLIWILPMIILGVLVWLRTTILQRWFPYFILLIVLMLFGPELQALYLSNLQSLELQLFFLAKTLIATVLITLSIKLWRKRK